MARHPGGLWVSSPGTEQPFHQFSQVAGLGGETLGQAEECHWADVVAVVPKGPEELGVEQYHGAIGFTYVSKMMFNGFSLGTT